MAEDPLASIRTLLTDLPDQLDDDLLARLDGHEQPVWALLKELVATDDESALRRLLNDRTPLHELLEERAHYTQLTEPAEPPYHPDEPSVVHALRSCAALGLALVGDAESAAERLREGMSWLPRSRSATSTTAADSWSPPDTRHGERLRTLLAPHLTDPVGGFLAAVLPALDGAPVPTGSSPRMTVLVDTGAYGMRLTLELTLVSDGPSCLVPNPHLMMGFLGDDRFQRALQAAWQGRPSALNGTVMWSLCNADGPVSQVFDGSLSAAFAVLLTELDRTRSGLRRFVRVRRINPDTAVVGRVSEESPGSVLSVAGYDSKLPEALADSRVIVPRADEDEARRVFGENPDAPEIVAVETVQQAARQARRTDGRVVVRMVGSLLVLSLLVLGGLWGAAVFDGEAQQRKAVAADLAAQANTLKSTDPRAAGLIALAGYEIDPENKRAVEAMREVLETNRNTVRSWVAGRTLVDALAVDKSGRRAYTSGDDEMTTVWDIRTGRRLARMKGLAAQLVREDTTGILAAHDGRDITLYDATGDVPERLARMPAPGCVGRYSEIVSMGFTDKGSTLTALWDDGGIESVDTVSHTVTACLQVRNLTRSDQLPSGTRGRLVIGASVVPDAVAPTADGKPGHDEAVLLLSNNVVLAVDLRKDAARTIVKDGDVPGDVSAVAASGDHLLLATGNGVALWDRSTRAIVANPLGGIAMKPTSMTLYSGQALLTGTDGTALVPLSGDSSAIGGGTPRPLSRPVGAPALAAVRAGDGNVVTVGNDARVTVLSDTPVQLALPPAKPSTGAYFGRGHTLLLSDFFNDTSYGTYTIRVDRPPRTGRASGSDYPVVRNFEASAAYLGDLSMSDAFVAAAGQVGGRGTARVWKRDGTFVEDLQLPGQDDPAQEGTKRLITRVAFTDSGPGLLVARHISGRVGIWSTRDWDLRGTVKLRPGTAAMALHGRRGVFVEGDGRSARLVQVDLDTRKVLRRVPAPSVYRLSYSSDGSKLAALAWGNKVQLLNGSDLTPVRPALQLPKGDIAGDMALSPDGGRVAMALKDQVLVYTLDTGLPAAPPLNDVGGNRIADLSWSHDGAYLAGATLMPVRDLKRPGPVDIWKMKDAPWQQQMCKWAGGGLTRAEWKQYVDPSESYVDICRQDAP
ncbi:hypothetical protein ACWCP6_24490 [Streptomyces sp. NPDC002004]